MYTQFSNYEKRELFFSVFEKLSNEFRAKKVCIQNEMMYTDDQIDEFEKDMNKTLEIIHGIKEHIIIFMKENQ